MKKINIFIVDDDQDFAESMADVFEMRGHNVELAFSGEEAIKKFTEKDFDITFMDVKLPGKNGVESFLEIRKIRKNPKVVMMTGYSLEQLLTQAVKHGAHAILHKPLDMGKVLELVNKIPSYGVILIADDNPDFSESIKEVLESSKYTVFLARNGEEAVNRVLKNGIDVLILDLQMPILNGLEVYLELKKANHLIPTIIVTAYADEEAESIEKFRSMSKTGILVKPFNPDKLLDAVENIIKQKLK